MSYIGNKPADTIATSADISDGAITAAKLATSSVTQPKINGGVASTGPAFSAYAGSGGAVTASTSTLVPFNNKTGSSAPAFDTAGCYNNTASTATLNGISTPAYSFAPNVAGYYQVNANIGVYYPSSGTYVYMVFAKNGSNVYFNCVGGGNGSNIELSPTGSMIVYMNGTSDTLCVKIYTNSSSTNMDTGASTVFSGSLVRAV